MNKLVAYMELATLASSTSASSRHWGRAFLPFADCSPAPLFSSNMPTRSGLLDDAKKTDGMGTLWSNTDNHKAAI